MPPNSDMTAQIGQIQQTLGEVSGGMRAILRELDNMRSERRQHDIDTDSRMDKIEGDIHVIAQVSRDAHQSASAAMVKTESFEHMVLTEIKPETDKIKNFNWRIMGFLAGISIAGSLVASPVLAAIGDVIHEFIK